MRLLVSVRNADEARLALAGGADLIDAKDPDRGPLGPVTPRELRDIVAAVGGQRPLSAALGDAQGRETSALVRDSAELAFVKLGFGGSGGLDAAQLARLAARVRDACRAALVLVAYADWARVLAPAPEAILEAAIRSQAAGVLLDTAVKDRSLFTLQSSRAVERWIEAARGERLLTAIAGSLTADNLRMLRGIGPDIVGVRGAACEGGRTGLISRERVARLSAVARGAPLPGPLRRRARV